MSTPSQKSGRESAAECRTSDVQHLADAQPSFGASDRLFNEANLLRLEGRLFCFDPKEAGRRGETAYSFEEILQQPLIIMPAAEFGYPSPLAYKILQAISKKLTEEGFPV